MNVETGELAMALDGHDTDDPWGFVMSVAFSPDGSVLASGSGDSSIILWNATDGTKLRTMQGHSEYIASLVFSPDGTKLASGADEEEVKVWDVSDIFGGSGGGQPGDPNADASQHVFVQIAPVVVLIATLCGTSVGVAA